jgi:hypothetical protein
MRDTIDMAFEAGFDSSGTELTWESVICTEELKTFEALVRADEREACAKVCDEADDPINDSYENALARELSAAIRARGT